MTCPNGAKDSGVASTARSFTTFSSCLRSICAGWAAPAAMEVFSLVMTLQGRGGAGAEGEAVRRQCLLAWRGDAPEALAQRLPLGLGPFFVDRRGESPAPRSVLVAFFQLLWCCIA